MGSHIDNCFGTTSVYPISDSLKHYIAILSSHRYGHHNCRTTAHKLIYIRKNGIMHWRLEIFMTSWSLHLRRCHPLMIQRWTSGEVSQQNPDHK